MNYLQNFSVLWKSWKNLQQCNLVSTLGRDVDNMKYYLLEKNLFELQMIVMDLGFFLLDHLLGFF